MIKMPNTSPAPKFTQNNTPKRQNPMIKQPPINFVK